MVKHLDQSSNHAKFVICLVPQGPFESALAGGTFYCQGASGKCCNFQMRFGTFFGSMSGSVVWDADRTNLALLQSSHSQMFWLASRCQGLRIPLTCKGTYFYCFHVQVFVWSFPTNIVKYTKSYLEITSLGMDIWRERIIWGIRV